MYPETRFYYETCKINGISLRGLSVPQVREIIFRAEAIECFEAAVNSIGVPVVQSAAAESYRPLWLCK